MRRGHLQGGGNVAHSGTGAELFFHQIGITRHQTPRGVRARRFGQCPQRLAFQPDPQQAQMMPRCAIMRGDVAVHFALQSVQRHIQLLLRMHFADPQMQRLRRQGDSATAAKKYCSAKDLRSDFKAVHHAGGNEDTVVRGVAPGHTGQSDAALTLGEP